MISRQFFKSSVIYSTVGALPYASGFLLLPWFTAYLTPQQFGVNALYIALMYAIQIISSFGMDMSVGVMYFDYRDNKAKLREFLGTAFISVGFLGAATFILFSMGGLKVFNWVFKSGDFIELLPFGIFTILSGVFNSVFKIYSTLLINQQRPIRFFWLNISNFILTISASLAILYLFPFTLYGPILGRLIPALITSAIAISLLGTEYGLSWDREMFSKLLRYSSPILLYALLTWIITYIDRFIILRIMGDAALVGVFDVAVKIVIGLDLVLTGLINTINPKVYAIWKTSGVNETTPEINRYYNGLTGFLLLSIPLFVFVVPLIIPLVIFKPIYYQAFEFLPILAAGYATRVWFFMFLAPIMFFKKTAALPRVLMISAIFDILLGIVMIKYFGLMGAVWTNFLIKPLQAGLMYLECRKIYTLKVNFWKIFYTPVIFIAVVIVSELAIPAEFNLLSRAVQLLAAGTLVFFAFRKELPNAMAFLQKGSKR